MYLVVLIYQIWFLTIDRSTTWVHWILFTERTLYTAQLIMSNHLQSFYSINLVYYSVHNKWIDSLLEYHLLATTRKVVNFQTISMHRIFSNKSSCTYFKLQVTRKAFIKVWHLFFLWVPQEWASNYWNMC